MTKIAYIAAPQDEWRDRAKNVPPRLYIPFTQLTTGELELALKLEQLNTMAAFYPEARQYREGADMVRNALYNGVSGARIGSIDPALYPLAQSIVRAGRQNTPASKFYIGRNTPGVHIGEEPIIPVKYRNIDCKDLLYNKAKSEFDKLSIFQKWKKFPGGVFPPKELYHKGLMYNVIKSVREKYQNELATCEYAQGVEIVLNDNLERGSLHMLYHQMAASFEPALGTLALTKRLLHRAGVSDIAKMAGIDKSIMTNWVELGQMRSAVANGVKPQQSIVYAAALTPDPEKYVTAVLAQIKKRGGATSIGEPITLTIGAITALVTAIGAALVSASKMQKEFNDKKIIGLQNANGFGTDAFSPEKEDFLLPKGATSLTPPDDGNNTMLLAAAAAGYFLLK